MANYKKKPVIIEAQQWDGEPNLWLNKDKNKLLIEGYETGNMIIPTNDTLMIKTLEGNYKAVKGDYIIKGVKGEFYHCKHDIFEMTYDLIEE